MLGKRALQVSAVYWSIFFMMNGVWFKASRDKNLGGVKGEWVKEKKKKAKRWPLLKQFIILFSTFLVCLKMSTTKANKKQNPRAKVDTVF